MDRPEALSTVPIFRPGNIRNPPPKHGWTSGENSHPLAQALRAAYRHSWRRTSFECWEPISRWCPPRSGGHVRFRAFRTDWPRSRADMTGARGRAWGGARTVRGRKGRAGSLRSTPPAARTASVREVMEVPRAQGTGGLPTQHSDGCKPRLLGHGLPGRRHPLWVALTRQFDFGLD